MSISVCVVYGCFHTKGAELNSFNRDCMAWNLKYYHLTLYRICSPTPTVEYDGSDSMQYLRLGQKDHAILSWFSWNAWALDTLFWNLTTMLLEIQATWAVTCINSPSCTQSSSHLISVARHTNKNYLDDSSLNHSNPCWIKASDISHGGETSHLHCALLELLTYRNCAHVKRLIFFYAPQSLKFFVT